MSEDGGSHQRRVGRLLFDCTGSRTLVHDLVIGLLNYDLFSRVKEAGVFPILGIDHDVPEIVRQITSVKELAGRDHRPIITVCNSKSTCGWRLLLPESDRTVYQFGKGAQLHRKKQPTQG